MAGHGRRGHDRLGSNFPASRDARRTTRSVSGGDGLADAGALRQESFKVLGVPAPKGSRITGHRKDGTVFSRPASKNEKAWTEAVATVARARGELSPPYEVVIGFYMPRPKKPTYEHPSRGDLDKFVRATLDGLTEGGVISDDRHVIGISTFKKYVGEYHPESGADITVHESEVYVPYG